MKDEPLTDEECEELMYLFRVCRAGNDRAGERDRLKDLMRRHDANRDDKKGTKRA